MSHRQLVPISSTPLERAFDSAGARIDLIPAPVETVWDADQCPSGVLPFLAWSFAVDRWDAEWPDATKRALIRASIETHRRRGTLASIRAILNVFGYDPEIKEWFQTGGIPGTFEISVSVGEIGLSQTVDREITRLIEATRPVSRHLVRMTVSIGTAGQFYTGAACYGGDSVTIQAWTPDTIANHGRAYCAAGTYDFDTITV